MFWTKGCVWSWAVVLFFIASVPPRNVQGLIDADYFVQSLDQQQQRLQCIEGGTSIPGDNDTDVLFLPGYLGTTDCDWKPEQQWHFHKQRDGGNLYNVTSGTWESRFSSRLYAVIRGFFMKYWPNPVELLPMKKAQLGNGSLFMMEEARSQKCFQNLGPGKLLGIARCNPKLRKQQWRLIIVTYDYLYG